MLPARAETLRLLAMQNAHIDAGGPNKPFQDWGVMDVFSYNGPNSLRRVLLQFGLAAIPAGASLTSAKLGICSRASQNCVYSEMQEVWRVENDAWNQSTMTWNKFVGGQSTYLAVQGGGVGQHYSVWDLDLTARNLAADLVDGKLTVMVRITLPPRRGTITTGGRAITAWRCPMPIT